MRDEEGAEMVGGGGASGKIFKMISLTTESDIDTFSFLTFL